jgi:hypothetical protein
MAWYPIGPSSYPDLFGQMQYVNSERIAQQWLSLTRDFAARFGQNGDRLTPNEGRRTKERCELLYAKYLREGYPVAAALYLSRHYELTHGNAIDAGVTMANGQNRALTTDEFEWLHEQCELRGFTWTGRNFVIPEPWHIEGATQAEHFPPYPGITVENGVLDNQNPDQEDDMFNDEDRARAKNIETMLGKLQNSNIPAAVEKVQTRVDQAYDRLGRNPADTASAVWKYGIPGHDGTKEARQRIADIDQEAGK